MNERNVAALAEAIASTGLAPQHDSWVRAMAKVLAFRGVLVPSALTEDEVMLIPTHSDDGIDFRPFDEVASDVRAELEEIARGGPA